MDTNIKNEFDAILQLWQRRINAYNSNKRNSWRMAIALWGALLFLLYGLFIKGGKVPDVATANYMEVGFTMTLVSTVIIIWGAYLWLVSNNALSRVIERVLANYYESKLQALLQIEIHPLDKKFFGLYTNPQGEFILSGLWKWLPWADRSILVVTGTACLMTCMFAMVRHFVCLDYQSLKPVVCVGCITIMAILFFVITIVFYLLSRWTVTRSIRILTS